MSLEQVRDLYEELGVVQSEAATSGRRVHVRKLRQSEPVWKALKKELTTGGGDRVGLIKKWHGLAIDGLKGLASLGEDPTERGSLLANWLDGLQKQANILPGADVKKAIGTMKIDFAKELKGIGELRDPQGDSDELSEVAKFTPATVEKIAKLTDRNEHTQARLHVAKFVLNDKKLVGVYEAIQTIQDYMGELPSGLAQLRDRDMEKRLKGMVFDKLSKAKADAVWGAL